MREYEQAKEVLERIERIGFITLDELFIKKKFIREGFENLCFEEKTIYKWYFFNQLCLVKYRNKEKKAIKEVFWDYINGLATSEEANKIYFDFCNFRDKGA